MANVWQIVTPRNWCCAQRVTGCGGVRFGKSGGLAVLLCRTLDFAVAPLLDAYDIPLADEGAEVSVIGRNAVYYRWFSTDAPVCGGVGRK